MASPRSGGPADAERAAVAALRFCDAEYPEATTVILGGSSSAGNRTPTSDIDILLMAPPSTFAGRGGSPTSEARVTHHDGERFDVFAYTVEGYREWAERDLASLRPVLPVLLTAGVPLRTGDEFAELRRWSADRLAPGPRPTAHQLDLRRYAVTDLIDDLTDATDELVSATIRADLLRGLSEVALLSANAWLASGKWLARRLRAADPAAADALAAFVRERDDREAARLAAVLLDRLGGRVDEDFVR